MNPSDKVVSPNNTSKVELAWHKPVISTDVNEIQRVIDSNLYSALNSMVDSTYHFEIGYERKGSVDEFFVIKEGSSLFMKLHNPTLNGVAQNEDFYVTFTAPEDIYITSTLITEGSAGEKYFSYDSGNSPIGTYIMFSAYGHLREVTNGDVVYSGGLRSNGTNFVGYYDENADTPISDPWNTADAQHFIESGISSRLILEVTFTLRPYTSSDVQHLWDTSIKPETYDPNDFDDPDPTPLVPSSDWNLLFSTLLTPGANNVIESKNAKRIVENPGNNTQQRRNKYASKSIATIYDYCFLGIPTTSDIISLANRVYNEQENNTTPYIRIGILSNINVIDDVLNCQEFRAFILQTFPTTTSTNHYIYSSGVGRVSFTNSTDFESFILGNTHPLDPHQFNDKLVRVNQFIDTLDDEIYAMSSKSLDGRSGYFIGATHDASVGGPSSTSHAGSVEPSYVIFVDPDPDASSIVYEDPNDGKMILAGPTWFSQDSVTGDMELNPNGDFLLSYDPEASESSNTFFKALRDISTIAFTYKGLATVSQLNTLASGTTLRNGWMYKLSDSGTLTNGFDGNTLSVTTKEYVVWVVDGSTSGWYSLDDGTLLTRVNDELDEIDAFLASLRGGNA